MPMMAPVMCVMALRAPPARRQPFLGHDALDVLHDHDRVVHKNADGKHHREQRQHVDGEAHQQQGGAGAEKRDRHHDGRDEGVTDVLQKQQHHQEHEDDGLDQRDNHFLDRSLDDRGDVVGDFVFDIRREEFRQLFHLGLDGIRGCQRIAGGRQQHRQAGARLAVEPRSELIAHAAHLDAGDIAQTHGRAVGIGLQNDAAELIG
jgi:hypothetical protein